MPDKFGMFYLQWSNPLAPINGYNFNSQWSGKGITGSQINQFWNSTNIQEQLNKSYEIMTKEMNNRMTNFQMTTTFLPNSIDFNFIPSEEKMAQSYSEAKDNTKIKQEQNTVE